LDNPTIDMGYWSLVKPVWDRISIYDDPSAFLNQWALAPVAARNLFAAHWATSEIRNGGLPQFFSNSTGVLAPEAVAAFTALGMPKVAHTISRAMAFFESPYPRDRSIRENALEAFWRDNGEAAADHLFAAEDDQFADLIDSENGGFEEAADRYAAHSTRAS
jgi:hypothetical protein